MRIYDHLTLAFFADSSVALPPELCSLIMSPLFISTLNTYSYVPSIMHRIESLIMASNLKKMHLDHCTQNVVIPTAKVCAAVIFALINQSFLSCELLHNLVLATYSFVLLF